MNPGGCQNDSQQHDTVIHSYRHPARIFLSLCWALSPADHMFLFANRTSNIFMLYVQVEHSIKDKIYSYKVSII